MIIRQKEKGIKLKDLEAGMVFRFLESDNEEFFMMTDERDELYDEEVLLIVCLSNGNICRPDPDIKVATYPNAELIY